MKTVNNAVLIVLIGIVIISISLLHAFDSNAQEFNQFSTTNLIYNPAFAGSLIDPRFCVANKISPSYLNFSPTNSQWWSSLRNISYIGYDQYSNKLKGGVGVTVRSGFEYSAHTFTTQDFFKNYNYKTEFINLAIMYAKHFKLSETIGFSAGIETDFYLNGNKQYEVKYEGDSVGDRFLYSTEREQGVHFTIGTLLNTRKFYLGLTARNLYNIEKERSSKYNEPSSNTIENYFAFSVIQLNLQTGYTFNLSKSFSMTPNLIIGSYYSNMDNEVSDISAQLGVNLKYKGIELGGGLNAAEKVLGLAAINIKDFRIAYSIGSGDLGGGFIDFSHELSIRYLIK